MSTGVGPARNRTMFLARRPIIRRSARQARGPVDKKPSIDKKPSRSGNQLNLHVTLEELEASLLEMEKVYSNAIANHDRERATACRRTVIQAKDRARLISRNQKVDSEKRRQRAEMVEWMLVWLENPGVFESWVALRKKSLTCRSESG